LFAARSARNWIASGEKPLKVSVVVGIAPLQSSPQGM
jgi:hypothetical protein